MGGESSWCYTFETATVSFSLVNIRTTKRVIYVAVYKTHHLILHYLSSVLVLAKMTNYYKHLYLKPPREFDPQQKSL